ncbi:Transcriptional regulator, contains XRE-family HTH domain [Loktanella salsilacus]|uniref:Transcriptional regulator, contains XRE-family HTH domain n=1 Tax=Loktanella salsilacus TaxID=195913 RepID=A0A1I4EUI4_9RHOB|nr:helix-turn-helix transcriptional regulator [Loktanella salsilacus]SFL09372.1 Transcriptional regulator, contains XRE-family HTH domain [Loktanella salsilacus]
MQDEPFDIDSISAAEWKTMIEKMESDEELLKHISFKLTQLTKRSGLTQAEIARRAGLQRDAYGRYMLGKTMPPPHKLAAIARVFGVDVTELDPVRDYKTVENDEEVEAPQAFRITPSPKSSEMVRLQLDVDLPLDVAAQVMGLVNPHRD